jgi:TetR/AcrR family transcriptional repressor of nem operon
VVLKTKRLVCNGGYIKSKGEITREKILQTARDLFNVKGFNATTINDLVQATGVKKGCLYFHFPSKNEIAEEVFSQASNEFMVFLDGVLGGDNPGASIDSFFKLALEKHIAAGFIGGCIFGNTALEMSDSDPDFTRLVERFFDEWTEKLSCVAEKAQIKGQLRKDISSDAVARQIIATIEGGIMMSRLKKSETPMRDCLDVLRTTLDLKCR